jgi:hypothetical protein
MARCGFLSVSCALLGNRWTAPCCDVFEIEDGKIKRFDCYPEGSVIFAQLGY